MPVKPIRAPMALLVIILVALSAIEMAVAGVLPLAPQASDTPNVVHTRYLRSTADVTTSEQVDISEKRRLATNFAELDVLLGSLRQDVANIFPKLRVKQWLQQEKTISPDNAFKLLKLDKVKGNLFKSSKFSAWQHYVVESKKENAIEEMFNTIKTKYKSEAALVKILGQPKGSNRDTVDGLRQHLVNQWIEESKTVESLFEGLKLKKLSGDEESDIVEFAKQFETPEFTMWRAFIKPDIPQEQKETIFRFLKGQKANEFSLIKALAKATGENTFITKSVLYSYIAESNFRVVSPDSLAKNLGLDVNSLQAKKTETLSKKVLKDFVSRYSQNFSLFMKKTKH